MVERLELSGQDINPAASLSNFRYQTPLHKAAENGHLNVIKYLAPKVPDVNVKDADGKTPRDYANEQSRADIVEFLDQLSNKK